VFVGVDGVGVGVVLGSTEFTCVIIYFNLSFSVLFYLNAKDGGDDSHDDGCGRCRGFGGGCPARPTAVGKARRSQPSASLAPL
jgi:hypothetical protein